MSEWGQCKVGSIVALEKYSCVGGPFGSNLTSKDYIDSPGIPVIRGNNFTLGTRYFHDDDFVFVSNEKAESLSQNTAYPGDLIFTQRGTIGNVALIPKKAKFSKYILSQNLMKLSVDTEKADLKFVCYYFLSPRAQKTISRNSVGSTIPGFNLTQLRSFPIHLPELPEQTEIADVLFCLDRRIESLRKQNETLEAIAQTLFKQWFINFEFPNADGKPYKSSSGAMEPSELGEIPVGWRAGKLEDIVDVFTGYPFKSDLYSFDSGIRVVRGENVSLGFLRWDTEKRWEHELEPYLDYLLQKNDYVVGMDGSRVGKNRTIILDSDLPLILAQRVARLRAKNPTFTGYVNIFLKQNRFEKYVDLIKTGTSIPHISVTQIKEFECLIPTVDVAEAFNRFYEPWFKKISSHLGQIATLTKTRDALLPKLMSGKLRIKEDSS